MNCSTKWEKRYFEWGYVVHTAAVGMLVLGLITGHGVESVGGWQACPPRVVRLEGGKRRQEGGRRQACGGGFAWRAGWEWMKRSWVVVAVRSEALWLLAALAERPTWAWVGLLPWGVWLWKGLGVVWPAMGRQPWYRGWGRLGEEVSRLALLSLGLLWLGQQLSGLGWEESGVCGLMVGGVSARHLRSEPSVEVTQDEAGVYHVRFRGEFELHIDGQVAFYKRMLVLFLGQLEVPGETRGSRRTQDGRTPFVRQEELATWFEVPQPNISRWLQYWLAQDWRRLLSQKWGQVLTLEVQQRIIDTWVQFPWWGAEQAWQHLRAQGEDITLSQVRQVARESGWSVLRAAMKRVYSINAESFRPRDEWLVSQLLVEMEQLVRRLEEVEGMTPEQRVAVADLAALGRELNLSPAVARRPLPWVLRLEQLLFGRWEWEADETVCCIYCGTTDVSRKSRQPRLKKYVDAQGEIQTVEVYRYYCHNAACQYKTFTNLPPNLVPYSKWTMEHHLAALQSYEWSHSVYRCTGQLLGVSKMTAYRWVSAFGYQFLPVATLFGVVRSSGVVGIDEKYVLVPKNNKVEGKMKRWMYVYFAVDCYTYDLLHVEIYPYNDKHSAQAFLLALRAKGYHPCVVVTDMRVDYGPLIAHIFPKAVHHECIFHALQQVCQHLKEVYGTNYAQTYPAVETLKDEIDHIFDARTKRTARRRYEQVMAQRETFVAHRPEVATLFDFLERHWPKLVNAIENRHIPTTNNSTEQVIRIFTQHYKTFCGFESIQSARRYLVVFEKVYRFTPFSDDAQRRIRGKCPLELADYEVQALPMAQLFRGLALQWPASAFQEFVPNR